MEKLYNKGFLSYPRTETTQYNPTINLKKICDSLVSSESFGAFAERVSSGELWTPPKKGKHDDKAHPPIHPVKNA
jgi:DNA topoisomerase-3